MITECNNVTGGQMNNKTYISAKEIQESLNISAPTSYKLIAQLNDGIKEKDPDTLTFPGYVQWNYFLKCINQNKG